MPGRSRPQQWVIGLPERLPRAWHEQAANPGRQGRNRAVGLCASQYRTGAAAAAWGPRTADTDCASDRDVTTLYIFLRIAWAESDAISLAAAR